LYFKELITKALALSLILSLSFFSAKPLDVFSDVFSAKREINEFLSGK
jgi:hypothetical protein